jgi:hypothetical protein
MDIHDQAVAATRRWVEVFVVGEGLCPFAEAPFRADRILYCASMAPDLDGVYQDFLRLLQAVFDDGGERWETALLIAPVALHDFDDYLDALAVIEAAVDEAGLAGEFQVASFHPAYRFDGVDAEDPANYSNRSPFPMFHLIREAGLSRALDGVAQPERIPQRNVRHLRALGLEGIRRRLA